MKDRFFPTIVDDVKKNRHVLLFLYVIVYLIGFKALENRTDVEYRLVHTKFDEMIPFLEVFIIPYFLWFGYIAFVLIRLCIKSREDFILSFVYIFGGMTLGLIIFALYPTMQSLRPAVFPRENLFTRLTAFLYSIDTPTNVAPSLHVYNAIGIHLAVVRGKKYFGRYGTRLSFILAVFICLSTLFVKQHSVICVVTGALMSVLMYFAVYVPNFFKETEEKNEVSGGAES